MWHNLMSFELPPVNLAIRALVIYFVVLILLRISGKRQLGQMGATEFVSILLISNAVQNSMNGGDNSIVNDGALTVITAPAPPPDASSAPTSVANADTKIREVSLTSRAVGISAGNGNNEIINTADGVIDAKERAGLAQLAARAGVSAQRLDEIFADAMAPGSEPPLPRTFDAAAVRPCASLMIAPRL